MKRLLTLATLTLISTFLFSQAECHLQNLSYAIQLEGEEFYVVFEEPDAQVLAENYAVQVNGEFYENEDNFYGPLKADCETNYSIEVNHIELDFCAFKASVGSVCYDPSQCFIGELEVSFPECTPNGVVMITLDFKHEGTSDSFFLIENDSLYGEFAYADLPIEIGPYASDCDREISFVVKDAVPEACANDVGGIVICCPDFCDRPEFEIVSQECDEERLYMKLVVIEGPAPTNITLQINEEYVEEFEVDGDYIYLTSPLPLFAVLNTITLCEVGFADVCCSSQEFFTDGCEPSDECRIYAVNYRIDDCQVGEEVFMLLDFEHNNTESDSFFVAVDDVSYGAFLYDDLPVEVGPLVAICDVVQSLTITDGSNPDCAKREDLFICCGDDCLEPIFEIVDVDCDDSSYRMKLALIHPLFSDGLYVAVDGNEVGFQIDFPYIYIFDSLPGSDQVYELTVCSFSNAIEECCYSMLFDLSECEGGDECKIGEIIVEPSDCIDTGLPGFFLSFEYANVGQEGFSVKGNGMDYGDFRYEELPIFINAQDNCSFFYEFVVIDNEFACSSVLEYGEYCCNDMCSFRARERRVRCEDGILTEVAFFLEEDTDPLKSYEVFVNGKFIGVTEDNNVFLEFETEIDIEGVDEVVLTICDSDCCVEYPLDVSECRDDPPMECRIDGVKLDDLECGENGLNFTLDFDHEGTSGGQFDLISIFGFVGTYSYDDLPVRVKGFPNINLGLNVLFICDKGTFCCQAHLFGAPLCLGVLDEENYTEVQRTAISLASENYSYIVQNPVKSRVVFRSPVKANDYEIFNASGQRVMKIKSDVFRKEADISRLPAGLYVVKIENEMGIKIEKLIISK